MTTIIKNVTVVRPDCVTHNCNVLFDNSMKLIQTEAIDEAGVDNIIDGSGLILTPGFIDVHTHGCGGYDTMDGAQAVENMAKLVIKGGTTSFLPTTVAASPKDMSFALEGVRQAKKNTIGGANILGAHLEGPFLCVKYKGAHEEAVLVSPKFDLIKDYTDVLKLVTLAPELDGAETFIKTCLEVGIYSSIGHTAATHALCLQALEWGARSFTHSYNAMSPLHHREPGTVGALLTQKDAYAEMICDNVHVAPAAQKVVYNAKGYKKLVLITDALRPCMVGDGPFMLGNLEGEVKNGRATLKDGTLAGSILTMNLGVRNLMENTGCTLCEAVHCATATPAALLKLDKKGVIAQGNDADLVLMTDEFKIISTFVNGEKVYNA